MFRKILTTPTTQVGRAGTFVVFQTKLWTHCIRLLIKNRSGQQAAALSYHTLFGIIPLTIVGLLIFQSLPAYKGAGENVKNLIYEQLNLSTLQIPNPTPPPEKILFTQHIDKIVNNVFTGFNKGTIALFSAVIIIWAALGLVSTIERTFNNIWHVSRGRSFLHRMINYWALLTLGPLLLGVGIYITTGYLSLRALEKPFLVRFGPMFVSYIVATATFFLLYFVLPNAKVQAKAAIWGAAVAALVWSFAKWGFGLYVTKLIPYSAVYGVLGLIPLSVLWIYVTWLIVLFGLHLTFTTQHLKTLDAAEIAKAEKNEDYFLANDITVINIAREITSAFETNQAPVSAEVLCTKLNLPADFGDKILSHLVACGILLKSSEPKTGFMPAQDPANIKLSDIAAAVATAGFAQQTTADQTTTLSNIAAEQRNLLTNYNLKQIVASD